MKEIKLKILNREGHTLLAGDSGHQVTLVYAAAFEEGDRICIESSEEGLFCEIRLEDTMLPALVYLAGKETNFSIPFGENRLAYSPKSFAGKRHLITARIADAGAIHARRNLALNPYDRSDHQGMYPHASANIETRGESVFAARNTVDGIFANTSHGEYPYQSWGINRRADAELKLEFGLPVDLDEIRLTLRADFPHDNYWVKGTVLFSDGSVETFDLVKSALPQVFPIQPRRVEWLVLKDLIPSEEPSPFPALTQLEAWGRIPEEM